MNDAHLNVTKIPRLQLLTVAWELVGGPNLRQNSFTKR